MIDFALTCALASVPASESAPESEFVPSPDLRSGDRGQVNTPPRQTLRYAGPERRNTAARQEPWTTAVLDELDHGILLVGPDKQVMLMNHTAVAELDEAHPLQVLGRELRAREPQDVALLHDALEAARIKGLRKLIPLGVGSHRVSLAIVPLSSGGPSSSPNTRGPFACMVSLGKRQMCERLSVQWFSQEHRLTLAEARVLGALCAGGTPRAIAEQLGVGLATVRTQIGCIRAKTGARDIRALVLQVALLPPMVSTLRQLATTTARAATSGPMSGPMSGPRATPQAMPLPCTDGHIQARAA